MGGEGTKEANLPQKNHWLLWHFSALPPSVAKRRSSPDQILMLKLIHGMDTMDIVDTTDHTDTDTGMEKDLLMLNQLPMLDQMLMPVLTHGMDTMDITDTTDLMDTDTGMERDLLMLSLLPLLMPMPVLMLMLGMGTMATDLMDTTAIIHMLIMVTTDHTDIGDTGERSKHKLTDNETIFLQKINFLGST